MIAELKYNLGYAALWTNKYERLYMHLATISIFVVSRSSNILNLTSRLFNT